MSLDARAQTCFGSQSYDKSNYSFIVQYRVQNAEYQAVLAKEIAKQLNRAIADFKPGIISQLVGNSKVAVARVADNGIQVLVYLQDSDAFRAAEESEMHREVERRLAELRDLGKLTDIEVNPNIDQKMALSGMVCP